jgi:hypothetical protein
MFTTVASLLATLVIVLMLIIFLAVALRPSQDQRQPPIARYTQNGCIHQGSLRKGAQRPNN